MNHPHTSVLTQEVLLCFEECPIRLFVDATLGAGGHSESLLRAHPEIQMLIGIDQDPQAQEIAQKRLEPWKNKVRFVYSNFVDLPGILSSHDIRKVDGILFDLGVSSMQLDKPEKGFSFTKEGPLDMRMDPGQALTAADIVNTWSEESLGKIFRDYGEEKRWRLAAKTIVQARQQKSIQSTHDLAQILRPVLTSRKKEINPLTLVFQGLRIAVNRELEVLEQVLPQAIDLLNPGGRLAVISFHSLEDRIVKNTMRFSASDKYDTSGVGGVFLDKEPVVDILTKKPLTASEDEILRNPRSRSAKLRAVQKL